ncbi:11548_t:CDS:2, partial [Dentiscutata erythropus]
MSNVYTLKDLNKKGHRLGSAYEQKLEKKIRSVTKFNSEINDLSEKLVDKYNEQEKKYQRSYSDIGNKISQLNASSTKVRSQLISEQKSHSESQHELEGKYTAEIKSLKSSIKSLKGEATLAQKASSLDKVKIISLEAKIDELEAKEPAQINLSEINSLRLELGWKDNEVVPERSAEHEPPLTNNMKERVSEQVPKKLQHSALNSLPSQIFSVDSAEAEPLLTIAPIIA